MTLRLIENYPLISSDQRSSIAFYLDESFMLWVTYEAQREFLSTPRPFVLIKAQMEEDPQLNTGAATLDDTQWKALCDGHHGVYCSQNSGMTACQLIFFSPTLTVECYAKKIELSATRYHQEGVHHALDTALKAANKP